MLRIENEEHLKNAKNGKNPWQIHLDSYVNKFCTLPVKLTPFWPGDRSV